MALTRKFLTALGIEGDKIDEIITAHTETVDALKDKIKDFESNAEDVEELKTSLDKTKDQLKEAQDTIKTFESNDWEKKYNDMKTEFDTFKSDTQAKETKLAKESAYRKLLSEAGISDKRIDRVMKVSAADIDGLSFDKDGKVVDSDKLIENVKTEWADFISTTHEQGAKVSNPPANNGGEVKKPSRAAELVAQYRNEHYGNPNKED